MRRSAPAPHEMRTALSTTPTDPPNLRPPTDGGVDRIDSRPGMTRLGNAEADLPVAARVVLDTAPDAVVVMDAAGRIIQWNPAAEGTFGWRTAEVEGQLVRDVLIPPALGASHEAALQRFLATGESKILGRPLQVQARHRDGHEIPVELIVWPASSESGGLAFYAFLRDVSQRKAADDAQEAAATAKAVFLAMTSHEIRTPLTAIVGYAEILCKRGDQLSEEDRVRAAEAIDRQARRMRRLVDDLLLSSQLESDQFRVSPETVVIAPRLERLLHELAPGGDLVLECPPDASCRADAGRLDQIVGNLVANALAYGAAPVVVTVSTTEAGGTEISVSDAGPGVRDEFVDRLFVRFTRDVQRPGAPVLEGVGLGLTIARLLAEAHGGSLDYEPAQGGGARFVLRLPAG